VRRRGYLIFVTVKYVWRLTKGRHKKQPFEIAHSPLVKTAYLHQIPNWVGFGRKSGRAGFSEIRCESSSVHIKWIEKIARDGCRSTNLY